MKKINLIIALFFVHSVAFGQSDPYQTKSFSVSGSPEVNISTSGGSIQIYESNRGSVEVEMYVKKSGWKGSLSDSEIAEKLEDYEINIAQSGNTIMAEARREGKGWNMNGLSISFKIYTPDGSEVHAKTSGGKVSLEGVDGDHQLKTSGGSIHIEESKGSTEAKTSGGSIKVASFSGDLSAYTSGGSINLTNVTGDAEVHTSGGSINMTDVSGSIEGHTSGGTIKADISSLGDRLQLSTSGGSIYATIPSNEGMDLNLRGDRVSVDLQNFSGESEKNKVVGTMNGGGIPVSLKTSGGRVELNFN